MTVSATLDRTVRLYRANFKPLVTIAAITGLLQIPLTLILATTGESGGQRVPIELNLAFSVGALLSVLGAPIRYGGLGKGAIAAVAGQPVLVGPALRAGFSHYFTLMGTGFVAVLCTVVGLLLLIVPGIYILFGLSLAGVLVVDERLGVFAALRRSWALADGKRFQLFGIMFAWLILQVVLNYGFSSLLRLLTLDTAAAPLSQVLSEVLVTPCYFLSLMLVIQEVRTTREGTDLALEAQRLAEASAPPATS